MESDHEEEDLEIREVKKHKREWNIPRKVSDRLPDLKKSSLLIVCSPVCTGKSNLVVNLLASKNMWGPDHNGKSAFSTIYLFAPCIECDETLKRLRELPNVVTYDSYDEKALATIVANQKDKTPEERENICIVCDDIAGHVGQRSPFMYLASIYRHISCCLMYCVQSYKGLISPLVRQQCSGLLLGPVGDTCLRQVCEEYSDKCGGAQSLLESHRKCCQEKYNFMYMRFDRGPQAEIYHNFGKRVWPKCDQHLH